MRRIGFFNSQNEAFLQNHCEPTSATSRFIALGLRKTWRVAPGAWFAIAFIRNGRLRCRYRKSQSQKSARSFDRRDARQAHRRIEKSKKMIVSAVRSRTSTESYGPRSPSMIHPSFMTSICWIFSHWSRGVATRPDCQNNLSSSITGSPVMSPRCAASVDLPEAPGPRMTMRFISPRIA